MKFLESYDFTKEEISSFTKNVPTSVVDLIKEQKKQVKSNLDYLKELGIVNYKDVFKNFYEMFLIDDSNFREIFEKYDRDDLIDKIAKNINIVEYL
ncbi:MAG: hypothetical protein IJO33_01655 [Bacilli bacterium]|nr:hypothetical protein [Bacilli bacterium]